MQRIYVLLELLPIVHNIKKLDTHLGSKILVIDKNVHKESKEFI